MNLVKHLGVMNNSGTRVAVVFMQIPGEPSKALVTEVDTLPMDLKDDLNDALKTLESQQIKNLGELLGRRTSPRLGGTIMEALHWGRHLHAVNVKDVTMTPHPSMSISLEELLTNMRKIEEGSESISEEQIEIDRNVKKQELIQKIDQADANLANNLLFEANELKEQAKLLMFDAEKKEAKAKEMLEKLNTNKKPARKKKET